MVKVLEGTQDWALEAARRIGGQEPMVPLQHACRYVGVYKGVGVHLARLQAHFPVGSCPTGRQTT